MKFLSHFRLRVAPGVEAVSLGMRERCMMGKMEAYPNISGSAWLAVSSDLLNSSGKNWRASKGHGSRCLHHF